MHIGLWVHTWIHISAKLDWISVLCQPVLYNIDLWTYFALFWFLQKNNKPNWNNITMEQLFVYVCVCVYGTIIFVIHIKVPHYHLQISWCHVMLIILQCVDMVMLYKRNNIKPNWCKSGCLKVFWKKWFLLSS